MPRAWVFGDDLDTDQIVPGRYAPFMVGQDFGCGSSREYAVAALKRLGVGAIVAKSFARIFFRNCVNLGIPVVESADAITLVRDGDDVTLDLTRGVLRTTRGDATLRPLAPFAREILDAGGVIAYLR